MAGCLALAVSLLAACSAVNGLPLTVSHYAASYSHQYTSDYAFANRFLVQHGPPSRTAALEPSLSPTGSVRRLVFPRRKRETHTMIFRGVISVDECDAGEYYFQVKLAQGAAHVVIDKNVVATGMGGENVENHGSVTLRAGQHHMFEAWWAVDGVSDAFLEVTYQKHTKASKRRHDTLGSISSDEEPAAAASAVVHSAWRTDIDNLLLDNGRPAVTRCDYDGLFHKSQDVAGWFRHRRPSDKFLPGGCGEVGGTHLSMDAVTEGPNSMAGMSVMHSMTIRPRVSGVHVFVLSFVNTATGGTEWANMIVSHKRSHGASVQMDAMQLGSDVSSTREQIDGLDDGPNSVHTASTVHTTRVQILKAGEEYDIKVYYCISAPATGPMKFTWEDPLTGQPTEDISPILVA